MLVKFNQVRRYPSKSKEDIDKEVNLYGKPLDNTYMSNCIIDMNLISGFSVGTVIHEEEKLECVYPMALEGMYELDNLLISGDKFEKILEKARGEEIINFQDF